MMATSKTNFLNRIVKFVFSTSSKNQVDLIQLILRLGFGGLMLSHGIPKAGKLFGDAPIGFPKLFGMSPETGLALAVFAELFCALLLILGLATRFASIPLIVTMAVAVFYIHHGDPLGDKESGAMYLTAFLALLLGGGGRYSLDQWWFAGKDSKSRL